MQNENSLKNYISNIKRNKIVKQEVDHILIESQIPKGNKILVIDTSVLFIDIRGSSKKSKKIGMHNMTKLYKIFSVMSSIAVREYNGMILQFAGDGFMAAFNKTEDSNTSLNALNAVKRFKELLENTYKPNVEQNWHFNCGYAIATGHIYMTRLKAKKFKLHSFGIFPGDATNLSSKLSKYAKENELLVDNKTYNRIKKYQEFDKVYSKDLELEYYSWKIKR